MAGLGTLIATRYGHWVWWNSETRNAKRLVVRALEHVVADIAARLTVPEVCRDAGWRIDMAGLLRAEIDLLTAQWECEEDLI